MIRTRPLTLVAAAAFLLMGAPPIPAEAQDCAAGSDKVITEVPWAQRYLAPERVWPLTKGGSVLVAVVDTGVSAAAPALQGAIAGNGIALTGQGGPMTDCAGRGTFMAGLIAARPVAGVGFAGLAPQASVLPVRITDRAEEVDPAKLAAGIRHAADAGADVIAVSVGTPAGTADLQAAVSYAVGKNAVVIASADSQSSEGISYPAAFKEAIAVSGISADGSTTNSSRIQPISLLAPGGAGIVSLPPSGKGHVSASGAGIAVAFVAGVAALLRAYHPELNAAAVRTRLEKTSDKAAPTAAFGVVDLYSAVTAVLPNESGETSASMPNTPLDLPPVPKIDHTPQRLATIAVAIVLGGLVLGGLVAAVVRRGTQRGWRSAPPDTGPRPRKATPEPDTAGALGDTEEPVSADKP